MIKWTKPEQIYRFAQGEVRYDIAGDGPDLVLVHGTPWSSFTWHRIIDRLAPHYRIHYYDLVGYGTSGKHDGQTVSLDVQSQLLGELLEHWNLKKPSVIAHDFGGAISLRAHLLGGFEFTRLALINVVALAPWGSEFFVHVGKHVEAFYGLPPYIHRAIVETYIKGALHQVLEPEELDALLAPWLDTEGQAAFYRQIAQADQRFTDEVEPLYPDIRCPVMVLWGEQDQWIPIATGKRLAEAIPNAQFTSIPDSGHLCLLEQPDLIAASVLDQGTFTSG